MKTYLECIPCFFNQIVRTGRLLGMDEKTIMDMLREFGQKTGNLPLDVPPPRTAIVLYDMITAHSGSPDPFREIKDNSTRTALSLYPDLKKKVAMSDNPVSTALKFAIAGNIIDFGVASDFDLTAELERVLDLSSFGLWEERHFMKALNQADRVLYLGDNTGETVFDRLFMETINKPVTYVVRSAPVINDATIEDAVAAGITGTGAEIISSGCRAPGTILELCSREFMDLFRSAPLIISKGQGNYETLSGTHAPIYYLLKAKCAVVARHLKIKVGDLVLTPESHEGF